MSRIFRPGPGGFPQDQINDPRLRGLKVGRDGRQDPYDVSAARYSVMQGDRYEQQARREMDMGHRLPLPYQAPSALAGMPSVTGVRPQDEAHFDNLNPGYAVHTAGSIAGRRQTQEGGFGQMRQEMGGPWFDARKRFGYGPSQSRGTGFDERWDVQQGEERTAGRLERVQKFDQEVMPGRPYLHIRAGGQTTVPGEGTYDGNAIITITAGNFRNGGEQIRRFWVGGGIVACFDLKGWESINFNLEELLDGTFVEFAWTDRGLAGPDRSLLLPAQYTTSLTTSPVPQGAYAVTIDDPGVSPVALEWVGRAPGNVVWTAVDQVDTAPSGASLYFGQRIDVKAPTFRLDTNADLLWWLRPI